MGFVDAEYPMSDPYNLLVVIPVFSAYILGSARSLKVSNRNTHYTYPLLIFSSQTWIAVQQVPSAIASPQTTCQAPLDSRESKLKASATIVFPLLCSIIFPVVNGHGLKEAIESLGTAITLIFFYATCIVVCFITFSSGKIYS